MSTSPELDHDREPVPATPEATRSSTSDRFAMAVLGAAIVCWVVTFGFLVVLRQDRFGSFDFDMGIHDQSIWLLAHGRGFLTVRGLPVFGHHASPGYYLLVPLAWLGGGPHLWNLLQVTVLALAAVPLFLLVRFRTGSAWVATAIGIVYLLHPALGFFAWELFHPEVIAIAPLFAAYYCSVRRRWGWFAVWAVLAVAWKEDVTLVIVALGILIALRGDRRVGLWTVGLALAWFGAWTFAVFPWINDGAVQSRALYADVGGSPSGILRTTFENPTRITGRVSDHAARDFYWRIGAPYAFLPLAAPLALLLGLPQLVVNLITNVPWTKTITYHYAALPLVALTLALCEAVGWLSRHLRRAVLWVVLGIVLAASVTTTVQWGVSPIGDEYRRGWWPHSAEPRLDTVRDQLDRIPADAAVSATYNLVPHLSQRPEIYSFPNPWVSRNFGIDGKPTRSPARVEWLVVDRLVLGAADRALLDRILTQGRFEVVADADDYVLARRVRR